MAKISRFEDIEAWKKAREMVKQIYQLTENNKNFKGDFALKDQIRRSAISVMSNIAEGYARQTDKEFTKFLYIAIGSNAEFQSQLYVAIDLNYISRDEFERLYSKSVETSKLIRGFIKYLTPDSRLLTKD
ncbi:MAG: four helix bundle protein [Nitrospirota bacterium]